MINQENELKLKDLIELHEKHIDQPNAVKESFLDGYFLSISSIAKNVRSEYLKSGFQLKVLETENLQHRFYQTNIYLLPYQYQNRTIYYKNTFGPIKDMAEKNPALLRVDPRLTVNTSLLNKILHECIHLTTFDRHFNNKMSYMYRDDFNPAETEKWVLLHLATEASVIAVELLSTIVKTTRENLFTVQGSCYQTVAYPKDFSSLLKFAEKNGLKALYNFLTYGFLAVNMRTGSYLLNEEDEKTVSAPFGNDEQTKLVFQRATQLALEFRKYSNAAYFSSVGFRNYLDYLNQLNLKRSYELPFVQQIFEDNFIRFVKN